MASISITITSNDIGTVSSSFLLPEPSVTRVFQGLRHEYNKLIELTPVETDRMSPKEIESLRKERELESNQEIVEDFLSRVVYMLNEKVKQYELNTQYKKLVENYAPIVE